MTLFHQFRASFARHELAAVELGKALTKFCACFPLAALLVHTIFPLRAPTPVMMLACIALLPATGLALYYAARTTWWALCYLAGDDR